MSWYVALALWLVSATVFGLLAGWQIVRAREDLDALADALEDLREELGLS